MISYLALKPLLIVYPNFNIERGVICRSHGLLGLIIFFSFTFIDMSVFIEDRLSAILTFESLISLPLASLKVHEIFLLLINIEMPFFEEKNSHQ